MVIGQARSRKDNQLAFILMTKKKDWGWYPPDFCAELGRFAFVFADVEGVAGELILVHHDRVEVMKSDWSRSGKQLILALRGCFESPNFQEMCDALEELTKTRNLFMHGEWSFLSETAARVVKRHQDRASRTPTYEMAQHHARYDRLANATLTSYRGSPRKIPRRQNGYLLMPP